jgi:hypothetical protein
LVLALLMIGPVARNSTRHEGQQCSKLSCVQRWRSAGNKVADTRIPAPNVCPVGDCLVEFVVAASGNQPKGFELTLTTMT